MTHNPREYLEDEHGITNKGAEVMKKLMEGLTATGDYDPDAIENAKYEAGLVDAIAKEHFAVSKAEKAIENQKAGSAGRNPHLLEGEELSALAQNFSPEELSALEHQEPGLAERIVQALVWEDKNESAQAKKVASTVKVAEDAKAQAEFLHEQTIRAFRARFWSMSTLEREEMAADLNIRDLEAFAPEHPYGQGDGFALVAEVETDSETAAEGEAGE